MAKWTNPFPQSLYEYVIKRVCLSHTYIHRHTCVHTCLISMRIGLYLYISKLHVQPIPPPVIFPKAQSQSSTPKLVGLSSLKCGKRDPRALVSSFERSFGKCHRRWDRLHINSHTYRTSKSRGGQPHPANICTTTDIQFMRVYMNMARWISSSAWYQGR